MFAVFVPESCVCYAGARHRCLVPMTRVFWMPMARFFLSRLEGLLCFPDDLPQGRAVALEGGCGCYTDADARFRPGFVDFVPLSCLCACVGTAVLG